MWKQHDCTSTPVTLNIVKFDWSNMCHQNPNSFLMPAWRCIRCDGWYAYLVLPGYLNSVWASCWHGFSTLRFWLIACLDDLSLNCFPQVARYRWYTWPGWEMLGPQLWLITLRPVIPMQSIFLMNFIQSTETLNTINKMFSACPVLALLEAIEAVATRCTLAVHALMYLPCKWPNWLLTSYMWVILGDGSTGSMAAICLKIFWQTAACQDLIWTCSTHIQQYIFWSHITWFQTWFRSFHKYLRR